MNLGPQLDKFEAQFGYHGAPWCGIFVGHALQAAGLKVPHTVASVAVILDLARSGDGPFQKGILPVSAIRPGDLVTFGGTEHVAIVTRVDAAGHPHDRRQLRAVERERDHLLPELRYRRRATEVRHRAARGDGRRRVRRAGAPAGACGRTTCPVPPRRQVRGGPGRCTDRPPQASNRVRAVFKAVERHGRPHRHTVQFMATVQPAPGSPLFDQQAGARAGRTRGGGSARGRSISSRRVRVPESSLAPSGGAISVSSSILTSGQEKFAGRLAELTGLDPRVISAWQLAEESGGAAQVREAAGNFNWLNIGYFDSGAANIAFDKAFGNPVSAAEQTADFLKGKWGGASPGIRAILNTVGRDPQEQMSAIANSGWASSHYGAGANLRATYDDSAV